MAGSADGLVDREAELAALSGFVGQLAAGRGGVVWVQGEPGIGKSALVEATCAGGVASGVRVFRARADELSQPFALRLAADCLAVERATKASDEYRAEIVDLLAGRGGVVDAVSAAAERLLALVDRECARSPVVVVGDDLQWADEASLGLFGRLATAASHQPLLVVGICRPVPRRAKLDQLREIFDQQPGSMVLRVGPLTPDQTVVMAARVLPGRPGPELMGLLAQAAGNPLYLGEVLDVLTRGGFVRVADGVAEITSPIGELSLAAAIGRRLSFLAPQVRTALRAASVLDDRFAIEDWSLVADRSAPELAAVVDEALAAGVLAAVDSDLTFRHPLIRAALHDELPAAVRTGLHAHAAQTLAQAGRSWDRVARHFLAAPDSVDGWALDWLAGIRAETLYARPSIAVRLLQAARRVTAPTDPRWELFTTRLTTALRLLFHIDDLILVGSEALSTLSQPRLGGEIALNLVVGYQRAGRDAEALSLMTQVLNGTDVGPPWRSRLRTQLATHLFWAGQVEQAPEIQDQAIAEGERDGDPFSVAKALTINSDSADGLVRIEHALRIVIGDDPESIDLRLTLLGKRVVALYDLNRTEWRTELSGLIALAERTGSARQVQIRTKAAQMYMYQGDWDEAAVCLHQLEQSEVDAVSTFLAAGVAAQIALRRDDRATADRNLAVLKDVTSTHGRMRAFLQPVTMAAAWIAEADGQPERAIAMLADLLDPDNPEYHHQEFLAETERLALATGDRANAELASTIAESAATASGTPMWATTASICRAMLDDDPENLLIAAEHLDRVGERLFQAFVLQEAAARLARRGDLGHRKPHSPRRWPFTKTSAPSSTSVASKRGCVPTA